MLFELLNFFNPRVYYVLSLLSLFIFVCSLIIHCPSSQACALFLILCMLLALFIPFPRGEVRLEESIGKHRQVVLIAHGSESLLRFVWDKRSFSDLQNLSDTVAFLHLFYNRSFGALLLLEVLFIPITFGLALKSLDTNHGHLCILNFLCFLLIGIVFLLKIKLIRSLEGKVNFLYRILIRKSSLFGALGIQEVNKDVIKAIKIYKKNKQIIPFSLQLIRYVIMGGGKFERNYR